MHSTVKLPEKREHAGEPEKDKSKVRSKKPTNAVSTPCLPAASCGLQVFLGFCWVCSEISCHCYYTKDALVFFM